MSKRDDDPQADMEVGMTTAERRRRRRRGGGLRVPSDNVPRRSTTPPVIAPVPEDPALAMSIAYSLAAEAGEAMPRATLDASVPSFEAEVISTVIDPVSGPVEQADFETKTREMTAVDLEALGLQDPGASGNLPVQRLSSPQIEIPAAVLPPESLGIEVTFTQRDETEPGDDVEVEIDAGLEGELDAGDGGTTLDQEPEVLAAGQAGDPRALSEESGELTSVRLDPPASRTASLPQSSVYVDLAADSSEPERDELAMATSMPQGVPAMVALPRPDGAPAAASSPALHHPAPPGPVAAPAPAALGFRGGRAQTVALSEEDLEEVREAARLATQPSARPVPASTPPPMPPGKPVEAAPRAAEPMSVPEIDLAALEDRAAEASGEFEVDVDGIVDARAEDAAATVAPPPAVAAPEPRPRMVSQPLSGAISPAASSSPSLPALRESQPIPVVRDPQHAPPPPPPAAHKAPPSPPPAKKDKPAAPAASAPPAKADGKPARGKPWFVELFDEDYLRTLPFLTPQATQAEADFVINAMGLQPGAQVLDVGCGYGRHAMELAARGLHVVGLDLSTPLLVRGGEEAHRRGLTINFVRGDMRELDFEAQFDGAYCLFSTFGYFDDETNKKTVANIARALRPGGRVLIEILNRDYVIADLPTRVWWEGDGCVVLEEVDLNYFSSRIQVNRSVVFDDGRQLEQEISVRAYSLHEVGKLLHSAGFRVLEVSGAYHTRGRFFGNQSRHIIVLAERKDSVVS